MRGPSLYVRIWHLQTILTYKVGPRAIRLSQKAVTAYSASTQSLSFVFAGQCTCLVVYFDSDSSSFWVWMYSRADTGGPAGSTCGVVSRTDSWRGRDHGTNRSWGHTGDKPGGSNKILTTTIKYSEIKYKIQINVEKLMSIKKFIQMTL